MKRNLAWLFCAILFAVSAPASLYAEEGGELLWWLISDTSKISGTDESGTTYTAADLGVTDARIRYSADDGSFGYLPLMGVAEDGSVQIYSGALGVGLPGEYYADISESSGPAYSFVIELGNWADGQWVRTTMKSESATYNSLVANNHISVWYGTDPIPSYGRPWTPSSFSVVPEPCCSMLLVVGCAVLALRRRMPSKGDA